MMVIRGQTDDDDQMCLSTDRLLNLSGSFF